MAVRNQHSRQSKNYIIEKIAGDYFYIQPYAGLSKGLIYQAKRKIQDGKLEIPQELKETGKTILVICKGKGEYKFDNV